MPTLHLNDRSLWFAFTLGPCVWVILLLVFPRTEFSGLNLSLMLYICVLYPVLEELSFRGFLQTWLLERPAMSVVRFRGLTGANLIVSLLFATAHLISHTPLWSMLVFFPSLVFGYFRERHDSVISPILLHSWYNTGFFLLFVN